MLSRGCLIVGSVRQLRSRAAVGVVPVGGLTTPGGNPYSQLFSTAAVSATGDRGVATPRVYLLNSYRPPPVSLCEALRALRAYSFAELPETVELSLKCNMTLKKNKTLQPFRGTLTYPHKFGKLQKILFVGESEEVITVARSVGADITGGEDILEKIQSGELSCDEFDVCICSPSVYDKVKKCDRILKAKTPSPRKGTVVSQDGIADAVSRFKQSLEYHTQRGIVNMPVGKMDFPDLSLAANIRTLLDHVVTHRAPSTAKTKFIKRAVLSSTFGPGFDISIEDYL